MKHLKYATKNTKSAWKTAVSADDNATIQQDDRKSQLFNQPINPIGKK
jgi:hypothetical protein